MGIPILNVAPLEIATQPRERREATTARETVFDIRDLAVSYGKTPAVKEVSFEIYRNSGHGDHRPVRVREEHLHPRR